MRVTAAQRIARSWRTVGLVLMVSFVLVAQLNCLSHWLLVDAPRLAATPVVEVPLLQRTQHAAELWSGAPCTCETEPAPTHAEPLAPLLALLASAIVVPVPLCCTGVIPSRLVVGSSRAVAPVTPPPQA